MKVMNNIIYSIYSPGCKQLDLNYDKIKRRHEEYALSVYASYVCFDYDSMDYNELQFKKLFLLEHMSGYANNVLYLDFDVIPTKNAKNIFDMNYELAMLPLIRHESYDFKTQIKNKNHRKYNTLNKATEIIFNTGVIAANDKAIQELDLKNTYPMFDGNNNEAFMTWVIESFNVQYQILPLSFNYILDKKNATIPSDVHFVHYSNKDFSL